MPELRGLSRRGWHVFFTLCLPQRQRMIPRCGVGGPCSFGKPDPILRWVLWWMSRMRCGSSACAYGVRSPGLRRCSGHLTVPPEEGLICCAVDVECSIWGQQPFVEDVPSYQSSRNLVNGSN